MTATPSAAAAFVKLTQREAVLRRPEVYVGSTSLQDVSRHLFRAHGGFERVEYSMSPVFLKIFDEIVTNALDASSNDSEVRRISVDFDASTGGITVTNDGMGIPCTPFAAGDSRTIPEVIFSSLHAGSNFSDTGRRTTGGKNGLGATLTNIWSKVFTVEIQDPANSIHFKQAYAENMEDVGPAKVTKKTFRKGMVKIFFQPDYERLDITLGKKAFPLEDLVRTRTLEVACMARQGVTVEYNKGVLPGTLSKYVTLLAGGEAPPVVEETFGGSTFGARVAVTLRGEGGADCVGFVNGVSCNTGTHIKIVMDRIVKVVQEGIAKKYSKERIKVRPSTVREHLTVVVSAVIGDPAFGSQTKESLTTPYKAFGFTIDFSARFVTKLCKTELLERVYSEDFESSVSTSLKKTKSRTVAFVEKYDPALRCASEPSKCTLILCEGDSAKALVVSGIGSQGRDYFGVFPLKGVPLNARTMSRPKVFQNTEIQNVLKILNIQPGNASNLKNMRYGHVAIFSDADHDGTHIAGLLLNFFGFFFPELVIREGFVKRILSPIIRAKHNRTGREESFLTLNDFKSWEENNALSQYTIRYLKGLGSSTSQEAKVMFQPEVYKGTLLDFVFEEETTEKCLRKFFSDDQGSIAERKDLILNYDEKCFLDVATRKVSVSDFLEKDLIHFSSYSVQRSIPSLLDGCAPARRKILYYFLQCTKPVAEKVAQAAASCAAKTNYHHGETSLTEGIVGLAQDFVGAGNAPYLDRQGQFGSRLQGGKDHAAARYIFTKATDLTRALFPKDDEPVLQYREDEGKIVEPMFYVPVVPVVLLNGAAGIGTGFATSVPCYTMECVCAMTRSYFQGKEIKAGVVPGYLGFQGTIQAKENGGGFVSEGIFERIDDYTLRITELPVGRWTESALNEYKNLADGSKKGRLVPVDITNKSSDMLVNIELSFSESIGALEDEDICRALKLKSSLPTSNMYLFDDVSALKKFDCVEEIVTQHGRARLALYAKRKEHLLAVYNIRSSVLEQKCTFARLIIEEKLKLSGKPKNQLLSDILAQGMPAIASSLGGEVGHDHLLSMNVSHFTQEYIDKMRKDLDALREEENILRLKSLEELWERDIVEVEERYKTHVDEYEAKCTPILAASTSGAKPKRQKRGAAAKKGGAAGGGSGAAAKRNRLC